MFLSFNKEVFKGKEFTFMSKRLRKRGLQEFTVDDPFFSFMTKKLTIKSRT